MNKKYPYSLLKKSILNKFEIKGGWVTDSKDINVVDKYKYGTLKYTSNDINLTLFQGFPSKDEKKMCFNEEPQRYPDIYGRIADMTSYYIHAVNNSELSIPVFADLLPVHTQKINVSYFTVSNYFPVKSVRMKTLIIGSTFLNEWLKPLQKMRPFDEDDSFGIRIYKSESQLLGNFNYQNQKFEMFFTGNVNQDAIARGRQINIINDSFLRITSYAHPYTSCDKGTVERHNGLIRRFIPKGDYINNYSLQEIIDIETWCNSLPRKILAYHTPDEIFERELDHIYQAA